SDASLYEVLEDAIQNPFSRYLVYDKDIDNIVAVFLSQYLISLSMDPEKPLNTYSYSDPLIVFEFQHIEWVFRKMTKERQHMAIVLDEYGGTEGILTHEDAIEAMIGLEIEDETDIE